MPDALERAQAAATTVRVVRTVRDNAIRAALAEGASVQAVANATGLSRSGVVKIAKQPDTTEETP